MDRNRNLQAMVASEQARNVLDIAGLGSLPDVLDYNGEFGAELVLFLPFCNWLSKAGILKQRRIKTYTGMKCFYDDLDCLEVIFKEEQRVYVPPSDRLSCLPIKNEHNFDDIGRSPFHFFPDQRRKFMKFPLSPSIGQLERPLLIIHNKYNDEWGLGPTNFISLEILDLLFQLLKHKFNIVYIRHGIHSKHIDFSEDHSAFLPFSDKALLDKHVEVSCFDVLFEAHVAEGGKQDLNTFKNVLYSRCYHFISSQGGGAHHIAQFSGSLLFVLHRQGSDDKWAYGNGYYGFMAQVPPIRVICRTECDLVRGIPLFFNFQRVGDRIMGCVNDNLILDSLLP